MKRIIDFLNSKEYLYYIPVILAGMLWKILLLALDVFPFNSDEAVVGLMARHILEGELPVFFYGQAYMGSLDAILAAGAFHIFGKTVLAIRVVQVILYLGILITSMMLCRKLTFSKKAAALTGVLLAFPSVNFTLYTSVSLGGYGEALLIGNIMFLLVIHWRKQLLENKTGLLVIQSILIGFLITFGFWVNGLTAAWSVSTLIFMLLVLIRNKQWHNITRIIVSMGFGLIIGAFPIIIYASSNGFGELINEFLGSAVSVEHESYFQVILNHGLYFLVLGIPVIFGFRPPWEVKWLVIFLIPFVLMVWGSVFYRFVNSLGKVIRKARGFILLLLLMIVIFGGYLFTSFGIDPSGRYFIPFSIPMAIILSWVVLNHIKTRLLRFVFPMVIVLFQMMGTIQSIQPIGLTTQFDQTAVIDHQFDQQLVRFLLENNEYFGYTNYWVSYPLAFLSDEELIYIPVLPYHQDYRYTERDNRYEPYTELVENAPKCAYIVTNHQLLILDIQQSFESLRVNWKEAQIGDYYIFYDLSRKISPEELQLDGENEQ